MKAVRNARPNISPICPVTKIGILPLMGIYPWNLATPIPYQAPHLRTTARTQPKRSRAGSLLHLEQLRHNFAIESLPKDPKSRSRPYLYMCVRCKWTFRVNDRPGSIVTIDQNGSPLSEPENSRRAATFAVGPCPALKVLAGRQTAYIPRPGRLARIRSRAARGLLAMWRRWSGDNKRDARVDPQATTAIMAQDLLR